MDLPVTGLRHRDVAGRFSSSDGYASVPSMGDPDNLAWFLVSLVALTTVMLLPAALVVAVVAAVIIRRRDYTGRPGPPPGWGEQGNDEADPAPADTTTR
jgi:hypothetical protein